MLRQLMSLLALRDDRARLRLRLDHQHLVPHLRETCTITAQTHARATEQEVMRTNMKDTRVPWRKTIATTAVCPLSRSSERTRAYRLSVCINSLRESPRFNALCFFKPSFFLPSPFWKRGVLTLDSHDPNRFRRSRVLHLLAGVAYQPVAQRHRHKTTFRVKYLHHRRTKVTVAFRNKNIFCSV